jgi:hypothetical protein
LWDTNLEWLYPEHSLLYLLYLCSIRFRVVIRCHRIYLHTSQVFSSSGTGASLFLCCTWSNTTKAFRFILLQAAYKSTNVKFFQNFPETLGKMVACIPKRKLWFRLTFQVQLQSPSNTPTITYTKLGKYD